MRFTVRETPVTVTPLILLAIVLGIGVAGYGGYDYVQQSNAVEDAVVIETTVTEAEVDRSTGRRVYYRLSVEHTYRYRGTRYTSERMVPGSIDPIYFTRDSAERAIEPYDPGARAVAYVSPGDPGAAFLERRTTFAPFRFVGFGGLIAVLTALHAIGVRTPGQNTALSGGDDGSARYETLFGFDRGAVNRISKRLLVAAPALLFVAIVSAAVLLYARGSSVRAEPTDPAGIAVLAAAVAAIGLVLGLALYAVWSFTEYRRLRDRISEPRPPSPFRHPSRLVTILYTNDGLDAYGRRVKLTGFALVVIAFLLAVFGRVLVAAS